MDNHTEVSDLSARYDDVCRRLGANRKEIIMRLGELHAEGVPSLDDILKAAMHMAALKEARKDALSRDEGYQRMLSDRTELVSELYKLDPERLMLDEWEQKQIREEQSNG